MTAPSSYVVQPINAGVDQVPDDLMQRVRGLQDSILSWSRTTTSPQSMPPESPTASFTERTISELRARCADQAATILDLRAEVARLTEALQAEADARQGKLGFQRRVRIGRGRGY